MAHEPTCTVQAFARLAGVSIRTLHCYEETGLLLSHSRTPSGHRRYAPDVLLWLQQSSGRAKHTLTALDRRAIFWLCIQ